MRFLRNLVPYVWAGLILSMLYLLYVAGSRFLAGGGDGRAEQKRQGLKYEAIKAPPPGLRILQFYANSGEITRGEHVVICYGVQDAIAVRIDPAVEKLDPAMNRCFAAEPAKTTMYTLIAESRDGNTQQAAFTVKVNPPPPGFLFVAASDREIRRGEPFSLCYGLKHTTRAVLEPIGLNLPLGEQRCVQFYPSATAKYVLVATGEGGRTARTDFTLRVK